MTNTRIIEVDEVRSASRRLVRELGFMSNSLARIALSPSSVHAIIELGNGNARTAKDLTNILRLEKSSISRLINRLINSGLIKNQISPHDARTHQLYLTNEGQKQFDHIVDFGRKQVRMALGPLSEEKRQIIKAGLENYASALEQSNSSDGRKPSETKAVKISQGYTPSLLGRVTCMHSIYYSKNYGFGQVFEAKVASEMAEFLSRLERPGNSTWFAHIEGRIVGAISIDSEDLDVGKAHLRWFIVDAGLRENGTGQKLISKATSFVDKMGFDETHLWTFKGLDAARRLYEREGYALVDEQAGKQWGSEVLEQHFVRQKNHCRSSVPGHSRCSAPYRS